MKKKFLSLFIIGCLFAGMGLSSQCFAAPHDDIKHNQHKELADKNEHKKPARPVFKKHTQKASAKRHQQVQKHRQAHFKAQKQHQKNVKKYNKSQQKINKQQNKKHNFHRSNNRHHNRK